MAMPRIAHATKVCAAVFGIALAACLCVLALLSHNRPTPVTADSGYIVHLTSLASGSFSQGESYVQKGRSS